MDINRADIGLARGAIMRNRDIIAGVKARLSNNVAGTNDYEVLRRAQDVASSFNLPVMIHMGQTISPLPKLLGLLNRATSLPTCSLRRQIALSMMPAKIGRASCRERV